MLKGSDLKSGHCPEDAASIKRQLPNHDKNPSHSTKYDLNQRTLKYDSSKSPVNKNMMRDGKEGAMKSALKKYKSLKNVHDLER